jgi:hypothetical protein
MERGTYSQDSLWEEEGDSKDEIIIPEEQPRSSEVQTPRKYKESQGSPERFYYDQEGTVIEKEKVVYFKKGSPARAQGMYGFFQGDLAAVKVEEEESEPDANKTYMFLANLSGPKARYVYLYRNGYRVSVNDEKPYFHTKIRPLKTRKNLRNLQD